MTDNRLAWALLACGLAACSQDVATGQRCRSTDQASCGSHVGPSAGASSVTAGEAAADGSSPLPIAGASGAGIPGPPSDLFSAHIEGVVTPDQFTAFDARPWNACYTGVCADFGKQIERGQFNPICAEQRLVGLGELCYALYAATDPPPTVQLHCDTTQNLECDVNGRRRCVARAGEHEACGIGCADDLYCSAASLTCEALVPLYGSCANSASQCARCAMRCEDTNLRGSPQALRDQSEVVTVPQQPRSCIRWS